MSALNFIVQDYQDTTALGLRAGAETNGVRQIEVGVGAHHARWTHRTGHHLPMIGLHGLFEKASRFLQRGCVMRYDDVCEVGGLGKQLINALGQLQPLPRTDGRTSHANQIFSRHLNEFLNFRNALQHLLDTQSIVPL